MAVPLYPLRFEPIFKTMLWGGTRLRPLLGYPPSEEPTGEAWLLSDVDGSESRVSNGPLAGKTLRQLMAEYGPDLLGEARPINGRFPLLLKFIDAKQELSVQVHPNDEQARAKDPNASGKTEAWVILDANPKTSRIYAGFKNGVSANSVRAALAAGMVAETLHQFVPKKNDCIFLPAGTVHAIGADLLLFEVQQTSDITYRFFDWNRVDKKTGQPRELHIDDALACSDFRRGPCDPVRGTEIEPGKALVGCSYFSLHQFQTNAPLSFHDTNRTCRILVAVEGSGRIDDASLNAGETLLLPASYTAREVIPNQSLTVLLAVLPDSGGSPPC